MVIRVFNSFLYSVCKIVFLVSVVFTGLYLLTSKVRSGPVLSRFLIPVQACEELLLTFPVHQVMDELRAHAHSMGSEPHAALLGA